MRKKQAIPLPLFGLLGGTLVSACEDPTIVSVTWDPLEPETVEQTLEEPTGKVGEVALATIEALASRVAPAVVPVSGYMGDSLAIASDATDDLPPSTTSEDAGTPRDRGRGAQVFLGLACPGDRKEPPYDFANGQVRLDSPKMTSLGDVRSIFHDADALLTFHRCAIGSRTLEGKVPVYFLADPRAATGDDVTASDASVGVAADFSQVTYGDEHLPLGILAFSCPSVARCGDRMRVVAELLGGVTGTFVLTIDLTRETRRTSGRLLVRIDSATGSLACTLDMTTGRVSCP